MVTTGAAVNPIKTAAVYRVSPATITPLGSATIACCQPNRFRDAATAATAASGMMRAPQSLPRVRPRLATTAPEDLPDRAGHPQGLSEAEEARSGLTRLDGGDYPGGF